MKLYSFRIIEGGAAVGNLVPCVRDSDSVAGLYDTVRNAFYANSGTGGSFGYEALASALDVASSLNRTGTPSPAYGRTTGLSAGQTLSVSCGATPWTNVAETAVYSCTGWKLYNYDGDVVSSGAGTSFSYTHPDPAAYRRLEWQWAASEVKGTVTAGANGSVSPSGTAWFAVDTPVTVTATPDADYSFGRWSGTLPRGADPYSASITFTPSAPFDMAADFGGSFYVATNGDDGNAGTEAAPFATISNAIEKASAAIAGGEQSVIIHVADGTYPENVLAVTNAIIIEGNASDRTAVKIGKSGARVFRIAGADAVLRNLTVQNGMVTNANEAYAGGNVRLEAGIVTNCVLTGGSASVQDGKGLNLYISGGIAVDSLLTSPLVGSGPLGPGAYIAGGVVSRCIIEKAAKKTGTWLALGSGAYMKGGVIENCLLRDNSSGKGAIYLDASSAKAVNCTIVNNIAESGVGGGVGGVYMNNTSASVVNCVIYGNGGTATAEWANKNAARFYSCAFAASAAFTGVNSTVKDLTDAAFKDFANGDYRPKRDGALFNAGDNGLYSSYATSATDLAGARRIQGKIIDIGCWEIMTGGFQLLLR